MRDFHYVYVFVSENDEARHYAGLTDYLRARLTAHNNGRAAQTSKSRPWRIETAVAFNSREKAIAVEGYLRSCFGRAFACKRL